MFCGYFVVWTSFYPFQNLLKFQTVVFQSPEVFANVSLFGRNVIRCVLRFRDFPSAAKCATNLMRYHLCQGVEAELQTDDNDNDVVLCCMWKIQSRTTFTSRCHCPSASKFM